MLERLQRQQDHINAQLAAQQQMVNKRFEREREKLTRKLTSRQEEIIHMALRLLDEEGLESVTLRALAKRLNMKAPALYWHFDSKANLVDFLAEAILQEEFSELAPRSKDEDWEEWIHHIIHRLRKAMLAHKDGARIVAGAHLYPAVTLAKLAETMMASLVSAGFTIREADLLTSTLVHFTFGRVIEEQSGPSEEELKHNTVTTFLERHPYLEQSVKNMQQSGLSAEEDFNDSIHLIIAGCKQSRDASK
jgi:TetR/AcrR family tetracycline transcriptional repressor